MGIYLDPGFEGFRQACNSEIYVDKSSLISYMNSVYDTEQKFICVSRPRRFGKSMAANMLAAYYGYGYDARPLFQNLKIFTSDTFDKYLNKSHVIFLNMQDFWSRTHEIGKMIALLQKAVLRDLLRACPDLDYLDREDLIGVLQDVYEEERIPFVFIIDEWDCIFRENQNNTDAQKVYLDFLRNLLKDRIYIKLAYMTGILPVKKYGSHSALNMFGEFSMTEPEGLAEYVGFTEDEVMELCDRYQMDFQEVQRWYDGYRFNDNIHIYSPRSVVCSMLNRRFGNYWTKTETYEALKVYIEMNFDGLKDTITELLAGARKPVETGTFTNDMTTFHNVDDVLTLLIHLGYLAYDVDKKEVFIPNSEVADEFVNAVKGAGWTKVVDAVRASEDLLRVTWNQDEVAVANSLQKAHMETSILTYNNENALAYTMSLAYYSSRIYYTIVREMPSGKGFADLVFLPRKNHMDKPAMIVELKWNKDVRGAIEQIKDKEYVQALEEYSGNLLLVGINYDKERKEHYCEIEKAQK